MHTAVQGKNCILFVTAFKMLQVKTYTRVELIVGTENFDNLYKT